MSLNRIALVSAALIAASAAPAFAHQNVTQRGEDFIVSYSDLNLQTREGRTELKERVNDAINRSCRVENGREISELSSCKRNLRDEVIESAPDFARAALTDNRG